MLPEDPVVALRSDGSDADASDGRSAGGDGDGIDPTDLEYVGPATATVIESAPFDPADVAAKAVSYRMLLDAGVEPSVAERVRRAHSLVWSFYWIPGADLRKRAERVGGLGEAEREWIAASAPDATDDDRDRDDVPTLDRTRIEWPIPAGVGDAGTVEAREPDVCPRCGSDLTTYRLDGRETRTCEACGHVGVELSRADEPARTETWAEALRRYLDG